MKENCVSEDHGSADGTEDLRDGTELLLSSLDLHILLIIQNISLVCRKHALFPF